MNFRGIIILLISRVSFDILVNYLRKSNPKVQAILDMTPENLKGKWYIEWPFIFFLIFILSALQVFTGLSDIVGYLIAGIILGVSNLIFRKPRSKSQKQSKKEDKGQKNKKSKRNKK